MTATDPVPQHKGADLPVVLGELPRGDLLLPYQREANSLSIASALTVIEKSRRIVFAGIPIVLGGLL